MIGKKLIVYISVSLNKHTKEAIEEFEKQMESMEEANRNNKLDTHEEIFAAAQKELARADRDKMDTITYTAGIRHKKFATPPHLVVRFFNDDHIIRLDTYELFLPKDGEIIDVPLIEKNMIMHYILNANTVPLSGQMIAFKETPEGMFYQQKFAERVEKPLLELFGDNPRLLLKIKDRLDGRELDYGDAGISFFALPFIHMGIVLWGGDEEFPPSVQIIFDSTITNYLESEGIIIICELLIEKLAKALKEEG